MLRMSACMIACRRRARAPRATGARRRIDRDLRRPQQVDLWVRVLRVCVETAACPRTADFKSCAPRAKNYKFVPFLLKKRVFYRVNSWTFLRSGGKHPFGWWKIKKRKKKEI
jgi:hypothetical protein